MGKLYAFSCDWCGKNTNVLENDTLPSDWVAVPVADAFVGVKTIAWNGPISCAPHSDKPAYKYSCSPKCTHELMLKYAYRPTL